MSAFDADPDISALLAGAHAAVSCGDSPVEKVFHTLKISVLP